jgi:hypothetical protein
MATIGVTVAWCPKCLIYSGEEEIGWRCPMGDCERKLIKRVGYICPVTHCLVVYRTVKAMKNCQHDMY